MFDLPCPKRFLRLSTALLPACHGHVSLYVTANKPAGGKNIKTQYIAIKHFPGVRVVGLILFVFYLFCFTFYVLCKQDRAATALLAMVTYRCMYRQ